MLRSAILIGTIWRADPLIATRDRCY